MNSWGRWVAASLVVPLLWSASLAAAQEEELPSLVVMDFQTSGDLPERLAKTVVGQVVAAATRTDAFRNVVSGDDIRNLLSLEAQRQLCGADAESCLAEIGGALGADFMVTGTISKTGDVLVLQMNLLAVSEAKVVNRVSRTLKSEGAILDEVPRATVELLAKALEGKRGTLVVSVSEAGATIKIDGTIRGSSPMGPIDLPAGLHLLEVEKTGFISHKEEVKVLVGQTTAVSVRLVPSPDFLEAYNARARTYRTFAWVGTGVAALSLGSAVYFNLRADSIQRDFAQARSQLSSGTSLDNPKCPGGTVDRECLQALAADGLTAQNIGNLSWIGVGVGGAAALYFWVFGEDPDRYREFSVAALPIEGGAYASVAFVFR
ncbi:MAG: PEGA domain-containing protein [Deltaproteobacteria bacterium]|nr:MAG: PEGA domain-containing protein [Deltaproteobacteria bacterium]